MIYYQFQVIETINSKILTSNYGKAVRRSIQSQQGKTLQEDFLLEQGAISLPFGSKNNNYSIIMAGSNLSPALGSSKNDMRAAVGRQLGYAAGKTKMVAFFAINCYSRSG